MALVPEEEFAQKLLITIIFAVIKLQDCDRVSETPDNHGRQSTFKSLRLNK